MDEHNFFTPSSNGSGFIEGGGEGEGEGEGGGDFLLVERGGEGGGVADLDLDLGLVGLVGGGVILGTFENKKGFSTKVFMFLIVGWISNLK